MVGSSKILTVSYGTFSCTLEGFDDPFSTMRSIAEYFRDLAADDRYFGAEPPTPDAEMLHRIAEREVQHRVEARMKGDSVVLRQVDSGENRQTGHTAPYAAAAALAAGQPASPAPATTRDTPAADSASDAPSAAAEDTAAEPAGAAPDGFAPYSEEDADGYDDISVGDAGDWSEDLSEAEAARLEDAYGEDGETDSAEDAPEHPAEPEYPAEDSKAYAEDDEAYTESVDLLSDTLVLTDKADDTVASGAARSAQAADDNSVAAKLSRIRAVVSGGTGDRLPPVRTEMFAGNIDGAFADERSIEDAEFEDVPETHDTAPDPFAADPAEEFDEDFARNTRAQEFVADEPDTADTATDGEALHDADVGEVSVPPTKGLAAQIVRMKRAAAEQSGEVGAEPEAASGSSLSEDDEAEFLAELEEAERADLEETDEDAAFDDEAFDDEDDLAEDDDFEDEDEESLAAEADDDIHDEAEDYEADADDEDDAFDEEARSNTDHFENDHATDEDTTDTAAEAGDNAGDDEAGDDDVRSAIQRFTAEQDTPDVPEEPATDDSEEADPRHGEAMQRHPGFDTARTEEAAFDRILEQTNSRMDDSEGSRRRSAIAHLKAAVAATKADRLLKRMRPDDLAAEEQSQYRDDLAKVVQPRRPLTQPRDTSLADEPLANEPQAEKASPLVLVSAQRVNAAAEEPQDDFEPDEPTRRFDATGDHDATIPDETGFAAFAERMGATDLPDLLEAAAAYTAFVEGNKLFSRPQLMRRVAHVERGDEFTREAGLRSFGQLLRQGKIQKLKRGQFTISEDTRFNPQARLAGE